MSTIELRVLQFTSVPKAVQNEIQKMILAGHFVAGQKLGEVDLADRLGVSRGPVREAFRGLEEAGLIRVSKNRGVFVREITPTEASELYEVRAGLDASAGHMLASRITDAQITELQGLIDRMDPLLFRNELAEYFQCNLMFHDRIVEMTGNAKLLEIYRRLINETHLLRRNSIYSGGGRHVSNQEHRAIIQALATRRPDEAVRAMRGHVINGGERYLRSLQSETPADGAAASAPTTV